MTKLMEKYNSVAIQYANQELHEITEEGTTRNLKRMKDYFEWAYEQFSYSFPLKYIAFPEYGANGYPACCMADAVRGSYPVPGRVTDEIGKWAKEYDCFVAFGTGEILEQYPKTAFNSAVIMDDKGEVCLVYRKTNPWLPDEFWPSPHDFKDTWDFEKNPLYPVAKTSIGNWGAYICNDGMTPEPCRQLAFNGAECMYHPELLMDPWVTAPFEYFDLQTRWNSVVNVCYHVAVHAGFPPTVGPPYGMQGGTLITDFEGRFLACCPKAGVEAFAFTSISIRNVREYRCTMPTHNGLNSFKGDNFDYFKRDIMYPAHPQIAEDTSWDPDKSREAMKVSMKRFWDDYYKDAVQIDG
jgi:predicted amidohydrolase